MSGQYKELKRSIQFAQHIIADEALMQQLKVASEDRRIAMRTIGLELQKAAGYSQSVAQSIMPFLQKVAEQRAILSDALKNVKPIRIDISVFSTLKLQLSSFSGGVSAILQSIAADLAQLIQSTETLVHHYKMDAGVTVEMPMVYDVESPAVAGKEVDWKFWVGVVMFLIEILMFTFGQVQQIEDDRQKQIELRRLQEIDDRLGGVIERMQAMENTDGEKSG